jgi:hypothetical protein
MLFKEIIPVYSQNFMKQTQNEQLLTTDAGEAYRYHWKYNVKEEIIYYSIISKNLENSLFKISSIFCLSLIKLYH